MEAPRILQAGEIRLDLAAEELWLRNELVPLRNKPFRLLRKLMLHPRELVTKQALIDAAWGDQPVSDAVLTTAIKELRRALGDRPRKPWAVETAHGRGYRFMLEVEALDPLDLADPGDAPEADPHDEQVPASEDKSAGYRVPRVWLALSLCLALVLSLAYVWLPDSGGEDELVPPPEASTAAAPASIALLPLDDMSPDASRAWFADGLAEEILNLLAQTSGLEVASRTSSFRYRGEGIDIREIGEALGVAHVLEGSVRTAGEDLRVTVQLIRVSDGMHVFSESWNRPLSTENVFAIQQELAAEVLAAINSSLALPAGVAPTPAVVDIDAYEAFLHGRELLKSRDASAADEAIALLREAVDGAPSFAPARAVLGEALLLFSLSAEGPESVSLREARAQIMKALELAPESGAVLTAASLLAMAERDSVQALDFATRAVARSPGSAEAHYRHGVALGLVHRHDEAGEAMRQAALLDPLSPLPAAAMVTHSLSRGRGEDALDRARFSLRWNPDSSLAAASLGQVQLALGDYLAAQENLQLGLAQNPQQALTRLQLAGLLWRVGLDQLLLDQDADPTLATARAAARITTGARAQAVTELAPFQDQRLMLGLNALDVAYWSRSEEALAALTEAYLGDLETRNGLAALGFHDSNIQLLATLHDREDPRAGDLRARLATMLNTWRLEEQELLVDQEAYVTAAWYVLEGSLEQGLRVLEAAAEQGLVLRELDLDPLFAGLLENSRFQAVVEAMTARAEQLRPLVAQRYTMFLNENR